MLAVTAACYVRETYDWSQLTLNELFEIASWDIASYPRNGYEELLANIKRFSKEYIIPRINDCLLKTSDQHGEVHLARIMGDPWME